MAEKFQDSNKLKTWIQDHTETLSKSKDKINGICSKILSLATVCDKRNLEILLLCQKSQENVSTVRIFEAVQKHLIGLEEKLSSYSPSSTINHTNDTLTLTTTCKK